MEGGISALAVFIGFQERVGVTGPPRAFTGVISDSGNGNVDPGERVLPEDIRDLVVAYAARHDAQLTDRIQRIDPDDLNGVHDAVFEAQGRVMLELAELRRVPNWQDLDLTLAPGDDEAA